MGKHNKARSLEWGSANRPKISNKLGAPNPTEGSDGDIQVRQTNLGAKLFSKLGGRWYDSPLGIDGKVKFGTNLSNYLSIDNDSVDIFTNNVKVASFGATTTVGKFSATSAGIVTIADIFLTGKIVLTSTGSQNVCIGTGNSDVSGAEDNISIGVNAGSSIASGDTQNVFIGTNAGEDCATSYNLGVGWGAILDVSTGTLNTALGHGAGAILETGSGNTYIGAGARASAENVMNETVIGGFTGGAGTVGQGGNTVTIGNPGVATVYMASDSGATVRCAGVTIGEKTDDNADIAGYSQIWVNQSGDGVLMFTDDNGTKYTVDVTAV